MILPMEGEAPVRGSGWNGDCRSVFCAAVAVRCRTRDQPRAVEWIQELT